MTTTAACRTCGTEPRENARFCDGCGAPVADRDTRAQPAADPEADAPESLEHVARIVGVERIDDRRRDHS